MTKPTHVLSPSVAFQIRISYTFTSLLFHIWESRVEVFARRGRSPECLIPARVSLPGLRRHGRGPREPNVDASRSWRLFRPYVPALPPPVSELCWYGHCCLLRHPSLASAERSSSSLSSKLPPWPYHTNWMMFVPADTCQPRRLSTVCVVGLCCCVVRAV